MYTLFVICTLLLLGSLQGITAFIDTSNYKILFDRKDGDVAYWDTQCRGQLNLHYVKSADIFSWSFSETLVKLQQLTIKSFICCQVLVRDGKEHL